MNVTDRVIDGTVELCIVNDIYNILITLWNASFAPYIYLTLKSLYTDTR